MAKKTSGITLIELLISISVLAILATFLVPQFLNFYSRQNLKDDTLKVAFALKNARDRAVNRENDSDWGVRFVNPESGGGYYILFSGGSFSSSGQASTANLNPGVQFVSPSASSTLDVIFYKIKGLPSTSTSIIISLTDNDSVSSVVSISGYGEIGY